MSSANAAKTAGFDVQADEFLAVFPTEIGWMGITGNAGIVHSAYVGHSSAASVRTVVRRARTEAGSAEFPVESDWHPQLRSALQDYARSIPVDFSSFKLQLPERTPFRDKVLAVTKRLKYGETTTYGQLARDVGHPGAARAVGTVMSTNRFPIIIPCHRVLAAGGKLGGYTSPAGTDLKQRLLDMEQSA